jgi:hypothetical protein
MGPNGMDDDAPASEGIAPGDECPPAVRREASPAAVDADEAPPPSDRRPWPAAGPIVSDDYAAAG